VIILQVIPAFPPAREYGGGPAVAFQIGKRLVRKGHTVIVFTTDADTKKARQSSGVFDADGMEVHVFPNISNRLAFSEKLFLSPGMISAVGKISGTIDIAHVHDFRTMQTLLIGWNSRNKFPYIIQAHGVISNRQGRRMPAKRLFDRLWGVEILKNAAGMIALNQAEQKAYLDMGADPARITILPNGVDLSEYRNLPSRGKFRARYGIADKPTVLYLGRLHDSKDIPFLLQAFAALPPSLSEARLVIGGPDDGALSSIKRCAQALGLGENILFPGTMNEEQKREAYVDADLFATPRFTGFPLTFLESMACGLPILTTDAGDKIPDIEGRAGICTPVDYEAYRDAMAHLLVDPIYRQAFCEGAKKLVRNYEWDTLVEKLEEFYLLSRRRGK
jgi:glycosyltransferase involved in cell wall biosynthesis